MPLNLLRYGLRRKHDPVRYFEKPKALRSSYDVAIIGGGGHGLHVYASQSARGELVTWISMRIRPSPI